MERVCDDGSARARAGMGLAAALLCGGVNLASAADESVMLSVKPALCITDRRENACELSIAVTWRSEIAGAFCLHSDLAEAPIQCWNGATSGTVVEERVVSETFAYWLTDAASRERVAEARLEVMTTDSDDRRRNRRRRHVWNIL
ncbi:MAG: DUF3019 domain-containing protein [Gammaproteobacteria bacterium]|nr:hypothetical protein [Gammaproteobacteria bacterium]